MSFQIIKDGDTICLSTLNGVDQRFKVINNGPVEATVSATLALPAGLSVDSYVASQGTFDDGTGIWSVGVLAKNAMATIDFCLTVADSCDFPAIITLTYNNDSCVESDTTNNVGTRTLSGVTCCDIVTCLGTIQYTIEAGTTAVLGDDALGTDTVDAGETFHLWSSDGTVDLAVSADAGGAVIDVATPVSTDANNLLTLGADNKHFIDIDAIFADMTALPLDCTSLGTH